MRRGACCVCVNRCAQRSSGVLVALALRQVQCARAPLAAARGGACTVTNEAAAASPSLRAPRAPVIYAGAAPAQLLWFGTARRETTGTDTPATFLYAFNPGFVLDSVCPRDSANSRAARAHSGISAGLQMKDLLRLKTPPDMSATILSTFYDIEMLYKEKSLNMNTIHLNSMLDKRAVGAPVTAPNISNISTTCSFTPGLFRRNSSSDSVTNSNTYQAGPYSTAKESPVSASTAIMNKENRFRDRAYSESGQQALQQKPGAQINSTRYKTELCRPFEENGACKYGEKCQFAHGYHELRSLSRHPKYKTEPCRTFHTIGFCPYGPRCHFIHNAEERRPAPANANVPSEPRDLCAFAPRDVGQHAGAFRARPRLHHSLSFSGFSNHRGLDPAHGDSPTSRTPPPPCSSSSCSASFYDDAPSPDSVPCANSAFQFPGRDLAGLLTPLAVHTPGGYGGRSNGAHYGTVQAAAGPPSPPYDLTHLQCLRRLAESPVFDSPPSPPDSLSDRDSYASGSISSSGSLSGSESPSLDAGRRLPIFSRLSISDD
ncbi:mRNA decay activator protein ZFP36L2-like isoform X2 [Brachyhypopomus gauderio]|uniref:mRNA decay activator protein ZFP36L2-like isoform X2 n=1 Tax=Brachyhypopomus gauderio TaxID=698409 RepID=UPI004041BCA8